MVDYQARKLALAAFGKQLKEPETREAIVAAYMADTSFTRENILYREVHLPATLVQNFGANNIYAQAFDVNPAERQPIGGRRRRERPAGGCRKIPLGRFRVNPSSALFIWATEPS